MLENKERTELLDPVRLRWYPNGIKVELLTWKTPLPVGADEAEVIARAQIIPENDGAYNIEDEHVRKAMAEIGLRQVV